MLNDRHIDGVLIPRTRGVSGKECLDSVAVDGELVGGQSSEHGIVTPANSSMAVMRATMALYLANCGAPTARVTESMVGMAMGISTTDEKNEDVVETTAVSVPEASV